jgi:hypothetical protein
MVEMNVSTISPADGTNSIPARYRGPSLGSSKWVQTTNAVTARSPGRRTTRTRCLGLSGEEETTSAPVVEMSIRLAAFSSTAISIASLTLWRSALRSPTIVTSHCRSFASLLIRLMSACPAGDAAKFRSIAISGGSRS